MSIFFKLKMALKAWINKITLNELLESAPHGCFAGCGATSKYLAYVFRTKPETWMDFCEVNFRGKYFYSAINEKTFKSSELENALLEIDGRLNFYEYVQISFGTEQKQDGKVHDI